MTKKDEKKKAAIDWDAIRNRMEAAGAFIEKGFEPSGDEKQEILRQRAMLLAKDEDKIPAKEEYINVVEFILAHERYAFESEYIREICPLRELTPVPCTPPFVMGIINNHGRILSVIDIKKFFDLPEKGITDLNKVIVLSSDDMEFGVLADSITGVRHVSRTGIQESLPTLTGIREEYLKGVTEDSVVVLDAAKLLSDKKIVVYENVEL